MLLSLVYIGVFDNNVLVATNFAVFSLIFLLSNVYRKKTVFSQKVWENKN